MTFPTDWQEQDGGTCKEKMSPVPTAVYHFMPGTPEQSMGNTALLCTVLVLTVLLLFSIFSRRIGQTDDRFWRRRDWDFENATAGVLREVLRSEEIDVTGLRTAKMLRQRFREWKSAWEQAE